MPLSLQKVCDIHDFFEPEIDSIIRRDLRSVPFGSRRAWEFAMIFRALAAKGKLQSSAHGLAMGAGTEKLIYAIIPRVAKTVVTDLYLPDSGWIGVRTESPRDLIRKKAPWPVDFDKVDAMAMDMRDLKFPDESFDFCWSTGSFEHIGHDEDFLQHFREVDRVLKPGGVYAFTTAVTFGGITERIPHNYYFDPKHLVDLIHASPLHAEPVFDCYVQDHLLNRPHPERYQSYGFPAGNQISKPIVSFRRGVTLTANVMVLTKAPERAKARPRVEGLERSRARLADQANHLIRETWARPQYLETSITGRTLKVQPQVFADGHAEFDVIVPPGTPTKYKWVVKRRPVTSVYTWETHARGDVVAEASTFRFATRRDSLYSVKLEALGEGSLDRVVIRARAG